VAATTDVLFAHMAAAGVKRAVCVQPSAYGYDHRYLCDSLRAYPKQLAGAGLVDPARPDAADELTRLVRTLGLRGIRLNPLANRQDGGRAHIACEPIWRRAAEFNAVLGFLIGSEQLAALRPWVERYPNAPVVIDHLARMPPEQAPNGPLLRDLLALAAFPNVTVKLSGIPVVSRLPYPHEDMHGVLRAVYDAFGPDRLMWATDFPWILKQGGYDECLALARDLPWLSAADRRAILGGTALRVWFGEAAT
jgi:predicted TIM-barrel fold metal-dependent hydrolase